MSDARRQAMTDALIAMQHLSTARIALDEVIDSLDSVPAAQADLNLLTADARRLVAAIDTASTAAHQRFTDARTGGPA